jgi:hypothetical protein
LGERPFGLDVFLWTLGFVVALAALLRFLHAPLGHGRRWMVGPLLLFAALFAWRDSPWLQALDLLGIAVAVSLGALREPAARVHTAALADYARAAGRAGARSPREPRWRCRFSSCSGRYSRPRTPSFSTCFKEPCRTFRILLGTL